MANPDLREVLVNDPSLNGPEGDHSQILRSRRGVSVATTPARNTVISSSSSFPNGAYSGSISASGAGGGQVIYGRGKLSLENVCPHSRGGRVENHFGKITLGARDKDFNPDLPVIGILVQHESDVLDHLATKAVAREPAPKTTKGRPKKKPRLSPESSSSNDSDYSQQDSDKELVLSTTSDEESNIQIPDSTRTPETCYSPGDFLVVNSQCN
uniref:Uncharacterized protein n=1 Tax=Timema tahoe TaxID=61484 RepID=A0A7R9P050_9NEOP|nr:unnamed protein product [Timema tahoe]